MVIGLFTDTFYPEINGVATSCLNLEQELTKRGHEVHVFAPKCKGWQEYQRPNIHYINSAPLLVLKDRNMALPGLGSIHEAITLHFDIVHTNSEFIMGTLGRIVSRACGSARVHTYHTAWEDYTYYITHGLFDDAAKKLAQKYSEWWCERFERVIAPTDKTKHLLLQYGVEAPIDIIPSGMNLERFSPANHAPEEIAATRAECGVQEGERVLLNIGRLAREKNIEKIMQVFPALHQQCPDVRFVIIGEGPQKEHLAAMAEELGVADWVSIVGSKPWEKIDHYYAIGDVFACASHSETQGLTYIEAMSAGLCVCAVNDPCLDGVIEDGVSGILSTDEDDDLLACLIRAFSPEGDRIRSTAPDYAAPFSTRRFADRVEECYRQALADKQEESAPA